VSGQRFFHEERFSRPSADLAGATADPRYRVWLEDWQVVALNDEATRTRITATMSNEAAVSLDLILVQAQPPALQGDAGLSAKSDEPGNASHYYSLTDLATTGTITIAGETFAVEGASWKDHEFGTSALGENALGWDWFALQLDDGREIMVGQIRLTDGGRDPNFGGLLVEADARYTYLPAESFTITPTATWESPHTGAVYPAGWQIVIERPEGTLALLVTPQLADQELHGGGIAYWEGTVRITGDATGYGYAELTGYADSLTGRF
jgi:predicted secreted hydrolase